MCFCSPGEGGYNPFTTTEHCTLVLGDFPDKKNEKGHKLSPSSNGFVTPWAEMFVLYPIVRGYAFIGVFTIK